MDLSVALSSIRNNVESNGDTWESAPEPCRADASVFMGEHQADDMAMRTWESAPAASSADATFMMADAIANGSSAGTRMPDFKLSGTLQSSAANDQNVMAAPGPDHTRQPEMFVLRDSDADASAAEECVRDCTGLPTSSVVQPQTFNLGDDDSDPGSEHAHRNDADAWWDQSPNGVKGSIRSSACEKFEFSPSGEQEQGGSAAIRDSHDVWWDVSPSKQTNEDLALGFAQIPPVNVSDPNTYTSAWRLLQDQAEEEAESRKQCLEKAAADLAEFNRHRQEQFRQRRAARAAEASLAENTAAFGGNPWARVCELVDLSAHPPGDNRRCDRGRMKELFLSLKAS
eukprot:TRINITY_DN57859_c0_g1_i1.p1 TRINITY_DN57859_c0_g1~~TRINITY_DN57859_c0_g1_i1.p1  ORF type:complete len:342 (-),score=71.09 TRINITY_DN57859_c0_g1_i1:341-1366(-)